MTREEPPMSDLTINAGPFAFEATGGAGSPLRGQHLAELPAAVVE